MTGEGRAALARRRFLQGAGASALAAMSSRSSGATLVAATNTTVAGPLKPPPPPARLPVAFVLGPGATMIDFAGPWEVFQDVMVEGRGSSHGDMMPFELFTVAEARDPLRTSGGMQVLPDHTFDDAPAPRVIVIPAMRGTPKLGQWIRRASATADVTMSVCTGAFHLARTGLLDGKAATTHHQFLDRFIREFPAVQVKREVRFVEHERVATAAGLCSGIDLALRVVERYFGRPTAQRTAGYMEYEGRGWMR